MNAKTDTRAAETVRPAHDLYYAIHKAIRLANARMLIALGQADTGNEAALMQALGALSAHLDLSLGHLTHENEAIHAALEARLPGGAAHAAEDHDDHLEAFRALRRLAEEVATAAPAERAAALRRLYQRFALFVADDLKHMHEEETELMPVLAGAFSHEEIMVIEGRIVASIAPAEMVRITRLILAAASPSERIEMVSGMKAAMPEAAFSGLMASVAGPEWQFGDWIGLGGALA